MTPALTIAAVIVGVAVTVAVLYPRHAEDRRDADREFARANRMALSRKRAYDRLRLARTVTWLPARYPGRFVAQPRDRARLTRLLDDMRETARRRTEQ